MCLSELNKCEARSQTESRIALSFDLLQLNEMRSSLNGQLRRFRTPLRAVFRGVYGMRCCLPFPAALWLEPVETNLFPVRKSNPQISAYDHDQETDRAFVAHSPFDNTR